MITAAVVMGRFIVPCPSTGPHVHYSLFDTIPFADVKQFLRCAYKAASKCTSCTHKLTLAASFWLPKKKSVVINLWSVHICTLKYFFTLLKRKYKIFLGFLVGYMWASEELE